jgi:hypothetical protein
LKKSQFHGLRDADSGLSSSSVSAQPAIPCPSSCAPRTADARTQGQPFSLRQRHSLRLW